VKTKDIIYFVTFIGLFILVYFLGYLLKEPLATNQNSFLSIGFAVGAVLIEAFVIGAWIGEYKPEGSLMNGLRWVGFFINILSILGIFIVLMEKKNSINEQLQLCIICTIPLLIVLLLFKLFPTKQEQLKSQLEANEEDIQFVDDFIHSAEESIHGLEQKRLSKLPLIILTVLICNSPFIFLTYSALQIEENRNNVLGILLFMSIWFGLATYIGIRSNDKFLLDYKTEFKNEIITKIIRYLGTQNLEYFSTQYINESNFKLSGLFCTAFNSYSGDDLIIGEINSLKFQCSELHVKDIDSDNETSHIFHGLFFVIDLPVNIQIPFGTTNSDFGDEILLDNVEFNELFKVFGNDSTEVFYILSSKVLEKMVNYVNKTGQNFQFSFKENKLYIAIESGFLKRFFEPPIFKSLWDYKIYDEIVMDFKLIFELLNQLEFRRSEL
jgi:Protein of unknown function (DUF3137)